MTRKKRHLIEGTDVPIPRPEDMPPSMPDVLRQYRSPTLEFWSDGSPVDDQGEAIFDAAMEYFGIEVVSDDAGWNLASKLLWYFVPGFHQDPKNKGGRPRTDERQAVALGALWHGMKIAARKVEAERISDSLIFRRNQKELKGSPLIATITAKRAVEKLNAFERSYLLDRDAEVVRAWIFRRAKRSLLAQ